MLKMKNNIMKISLTNQSMFNSGNIFRALFAITLLCASPLISRADFSGGDTLASGSANWVPVPQFTSGNGQLLFQNSRAEFIVNSPVQGDNVISERWNVNSGSYTKDWSVQVDVHLGLIGLPSLPLGSGSNDCSFVNLNLIIVSSKNLNNAYSIAIDRYRTSSGSYFSDFEAGTMNSINSTIFDNSTDGTLKISYNSTKKTLTASYNNGGGWNVIDSVNIASGSNSWGMGTSDIFYAVLASNSGITTGSSGSAAGAVASGDAYYKNFLITTGTVASGTYSTDFDGLWDITGDYSGYIAENMWLDFSITQDPTGKFTGTGTLSSDDGSGTVMNGPMNISGALKTSGSTTLVSMTATVVSGTGTINVGGPKDNMSFTGAIKLTGALDAANGKLVVTGGSASAKILDLITNKKISKSTKLGPAIYPAELDLPDDVTGACTLTLDLTPVGTTYTGSASIETSTGSTVDFSATGSFSTKTNSSSLSLKGINGSTGSVSMVILTSGTEMTVKSAKGKVLGQTLNYTAQ